MIDVFRNNGIIIFNSDPFGSKSIDSTGTDTQIPILVEIKNAQKRAQDTLVEIPYRIQKVKRISMYVDDPSKRINTYTDSIDQGNTSDCFQRENLRTIQTCSPKALKLKKICRIAMPNEQQLIGTLMNSAKL